MHRSVAGAAVLALMLIVAPPAGATIKLGKVAPSGAFPGSCGDCEAFALETAPASPTYVVPQGRWTIISWQAQGDTNLPGRARLRLYRPIETGRFKLVDQSRSERFAPGTKSGHGANIRARAGDILGIKTIAAMPIVYQTAADGDEIAAPECAPRVGDEVGSGTGCSLTTTTMQRVNVAATLKRRG